MKARLKKESLAVAGKKFASPLRWIAAFFILGCIWMVVVDYAPSEVVPQNQRLSAASAAVPADWKVIGQRAVDKWTIKGDIISVFAPNPIQDAERLVKERVTSQGFIPVNSSGSGGNRRLIFCRNSLAMDVEMRQNKAGTSVYFGAYWAAQKHDSRFCRS